MKAVAVIGAGVNGLTSGLELLRAGFEVTVFAAQISPNTTSNVAAAIWMPYKVQPQEQALRWAVGSLERFRQLATEAPAAGILFKTHLELHETPEPKPEWMNYLEFLPLPDYLPEKYHEHSYCVKIPVIDTQKYMPYLHELFLSQGGKIKIATISRFEDLLDQFQLVINCSGLGAKELAHDDLVYPIRGQVLRIQKPSGFDDSMVRPSDSLAHLISRSNDCLLGGTADENNWSVEIDPEVTREILAKAEEIYPPLRKDAVVILQELVGLRPGRSQVRLETQNFGTDRAVVHNYGHGGAGIALSWGCALEVLRLVKNFVVRCEQQETPATPQGSLPNSNRQIYNLLKSQGHFADNEAFLMPKVTLVLIGESHDDAAAPNLTAKHVRKSLQMGLRTTVLREDAKVETLKALKANRNADIPLLAAIDAARKLKRNAKGSFNKSEYMAIEALRAHLIEFEALDDEVAAQMLIEDLALQASYADIFSRYKEEVKLFTLLEEAGPKLSFACIDLDMSAESDATLERLIELEPSRMAHMTPLVFSQISAMARTGGVIFFTSLGLVHPCRLASY